MKQTYSAGGIVLNKSGEVLLVNEGGNFWGLPKGQIEPGEDAMTAAKREIEEEAGAIDLTYIGDLGNYQRHPHNFGKGDPSELKNIRIFLFVAEHAPIAKNIEGNEYRWVMPEQVVSLLSDPKDKLFFNSKLTDIKQVHKT